MGVFVDENAHGNFYFFWRHYHLIFYTKLAAFTTTHLYICFKLGNPKFPTYYSLYPSSSAI